MEKLQLRRLSNGQKVVYITFFIFYTLLIASTFSIVIFGFIQGLKTHTEAVLTPFALPTVWQWRNYIDAFTMLEVGGVTFLGMTLNSIWWAVGNVLVQMWGSFCITYVIVKYRFPGSKFLNTLSLILIVMPLYGGSGAEYKFLHELGITNSPLFLISQIGGLGSSYLLMKAFIEGVSPTYAEAAYIDGASDFRIMWFIDFPQLISPFMAIAITQFATAWNEFSVPLLYLKDMPVISVGLNMFKDDMIYRVRMDILYAAAMLAVIPIWILYGVCNKTLLNLTFGGGIKG